MRVALYGGSFNPPHVGHLLVTAWLLATADVDEIWLLPTWVHAFGKELAPFVDRVVMCERLAAHFRDRVVVSSVESEVPSGRTLDTLEHLMARHPGVSFRLVVGTDILAETAQWKAWDRVVELAPPILVARGGHPHPEAEDPVMPEVSSTEIRRRLAEGEPVDRLVPATVLDYVRERGLYGVG